MTRLGVVALMGRDGGVAGDGPFGRGRGRADEGLAERCELALDAG